MNIKKREALQSTCFSIFFFILSIKKFLWLQVQLAIDKRNSLLRTLKVNKGFNMYSLFIILQESPFPSHQDKLHSLYFLDTELAHEVQPMIHLLMTFDRPRL